MRRDKPLKRSRLRIAGRFGKAGGSVPAGPRCSPSVRHRWPAGL
ncbi:hypothetical protein PCL1606_35730 [Pseudomonas chlororaphis]|uniref:Uncharacterized protein n=1 Tax=Pseudomonas chlororaphis TaxID=587753 RepID=A0A0D5Y222_9PSED|nr:hypothetical protein PCL1606_35730 [Pseudomonas chlororaphis]